MRYTPTVEENCSYNFNCKSHPDLSLINQSIGIILYIEPLLHNTHPDLNNLPNNQSITNIEMLTIKAEQSLCHNLIRKEKKNGNQTFIPPPGQLLKIAYSQGE